jgi:predicted nucleic-acid-binding protein
VIAVDTNVLVRLLVRDDEPQVRRVLGLLASTREAKEKWFVAVPVLCELVWVLAGAFRVPRPQIADALAGLLDEDLYEVENRTAVGAALGRYRRGRGDFADYLVAALGRERGARLTYTFDRSLHREPDFALL